MKFKLIMKIIYQFCIHCLIQLIKGLQVVIITNVKKLKEVI